MIIEHFLEMIVPYVAGVLEIIGVLFIIVGVVYALYKLISRRNRVETRHVKLILSEYMTVALDFLLAAEILYTIVVGSWSDIVLIAAIMIMRVGLTALLHWEINVLEKNEDQRQHLSEREARTKDE